MSTGSNIEADSKTWRLTYQIAAISLVNIKLLILKLESPTKILGRTDVPTRRTRDLAREDVSDLNHLSISIKLFILIKEHRSWFQTAGPTFQTPAPH